MKNHRFRLMATALAATALLAGACGDDASGDSGGASIDETTTTAAPLSTESTATTVATTTTEAPDEPDLVPEPAFEGELAGLFSIAEASCGDAEVSGSYFRMLQPGGSATDGPFVPNTDSTCVDPSFTPLLPGSDGGFISGGFQPAPDPPFDADGNGLARSVTAPTPFFGVAFAVSSEDEGAAPLITATEGTLTGELSGWTANYATLVFGQGTPKPDGSLPGLTSELSGSIDPATGAYVLDWASQIVGGSFDQFTGIWHLEGVFVAEG